MGEATWSPTPFAESLGTLAKLAAGYVLMPADDEVLECARAGVRRAIDRLNTRPWNWAITYDDITFLSTTSEYPLTSWFKAPRNFEIWNTDSVAIARLEYKSWKTFLTEHQDLTAETEPCVYSCSNVNAFGSVSLNCVPTENWVAKYPTGRLWYFRRVQYPQDPGDTIDVPSEVIGFILATAEGFTADRYAVNKAESAYARAERFHHELVVDDAHGQQTDWE